MLRNAPAHARPVLGSSRRRAPNRIGFAGAQIERFMRPAPVEYLSSPPERSISMRRTPREI